VQQGSGPRPYDVSPRVLLEADPASWLAWLGLPADGPVRTIDTDVSTVLAEVDKLVRVGGPSPWLAHVELQAGRDRQFPYRMLQYHALLLHRYGLPVDSTVVLLRPAADGPEMSGRLEQRGPTGDVTLAFAFRVVRLWERPVEELLGGGLGVLPLAPLAAIEPERLPSVMRQIADRFLREAEPSAARELWAASTLLLGLRYDDEQIREVMQAMSWVRESSAYRVLVEEGRAEGRAMGLAEGEVIGARRVLLDLATAKLGPPSPEDRAAVEAIADLDALRRMGRRILTATSWQEVLAAASDG
jgi:predicted transposase YdaD